MSQHWRCTAEPEKHGVWAADKLAKVRIGTAERLACPLCLVEHKDGWVQPAVKP